MAYTSRELTLCIAALEYTWLLDHREGLSDGAIAHRDGVTVGRIRFGRARAATAPAPSPEPITSAELGIIRGTLTCAYWSGTDRSEAD